MIAEAAIGVWVFGNLIAGSGTEEKSEDDKVPGAAIGALLLMASVFIAPLAAIAAAASSQKQRREIQEIQSEFEEKHPEPPTMEI